MTRELLERALRFVLDSGHGEWSSAGGWYECEMCDEYMSHKPSCPTAALIADLEMEIAAVGAAVCDALLETRADRDSWRQQNDARVADCLRLGAERDGARAELAEAKRINADWRRDWSSVAEAAGENWDIMATSLSGRIANLRADAGWRNYFLAEADTQKLRAQMAEKQRDEAMAAISAAREATIEECAIACDVKAKGFDHGGARDELVAHGIRYAALTVRSLLCALPPRDSKTEGST